MAKAKRTARVRYDDGKQSGTERYILETYNYDIGKWEEIKTTDFVTAVEHPSTEKEYIHYSMLTEVIWLFSQEYSVEI